MTATLPLGPPTSPPVNPSGPVNRPGARTPAGSSGREQTAAGDEFLDLVRRLLGGADSPGGPAGTDPGTEATTKGKPEAKTTDDADGGDDAVEPGPGTVGSFWSLVLPVVQAALAAVPGATGKAGTGPGTGADAAVTGTVPDGETGAGSDAATAAALVAEATTPVPGLSGAQVAQSAPRAGAAAAGLASPAPDDAKSGTGAADAAPSAAVTTSVTASVSAPAPGTPVGAAAGPGAVARPEATTPAPVTNQVFPEVVRIATTGTQRVIVKLHPESMGEVRVVISTHRGELRVSLSAEGNTTRGALLDGAPELRRMLAAVGSADARIVVRDHAPTPGAPATSTGTEAHGNGNGNGNGSAYAGQPGGAAGGTADGTGRDRPDRQAPAPGRTTATDGTPDATNPSRQTQSVTRSRAAGVDVTM